VIGPHGRDFALTTRLGERRGEFGFAHADGGLENGESCEKQTLRRVVKIVLKRGGREGPNVTNPTLTHDRPTKLFAFLGPLQR
jgi:hypothetical protein